MIKMKHIRLWTLCCVLLAIFGCDEKEPGLTSSLKVSFGEQAASYFENADTVSILLTLSSAAPKDLPVRIAIKREDNITEGKDYVLPSKEIVIPKGKSYANLKLVLKNDAVTNDFRSLELEILSIEGAVVDKTKSICKILILDDESQCGVIFKNNEMTFRENAGTVRIPVIVEGQSNEDIQLELEVIEETAREGETADFTIESKELGIPAGVREAAVLLHLNDNEAIDPNRTFAIRIKRVKGAMLVTSGSNCNILILNDDLALSFGKTKDTVWESQPKVTIPVQLQGIAENDIQVLINVGHAGTAEEKKHFNIVNKIVTIPVGESSAEVEVTLLPNLIADIDRTIQLEIVEAEGVEKQPVFLEKDCEIVVLDENNKVSVGTTEPQTDYSKVRIPIVLPRPLLHDIDYRVEITSDDVPLDGVSDKLYTLPHGEISQDIEIITGGLTAASGSIQVKILEVEGGKIGTPGEISLTQRPVTAFDETSSGENWEVVFFTTEEPGADGPAVASKILDGQTNTFWHSAWYTSNLIKNPPFYLTVDMKSKKNIAEIEVWNREGKRDTRVVELWLSDENVNEKYIKAGEIRWNASGSPDKLSCTLKDNTTGNFYMSGRYLQLRVTECNGTVASLARVHVSKGWNYEE